MTATFSGKYDSLSDAEADAIDSSLERLMTEHETVWARQNLVRGDGTGHWDSAWVIPLRVGGKGFHLYWQYHADDEIVLVGLAEINS